MTHDEETSAVQTSGLEVPYAENELTWGSLCHFSALMGMIWWVPIFGNWTPIGHLLAPFFIWALKRKKSPYIDNNGKESLNFQLAVTVCCLLLSFIPIDFVSTYSVAILAVCDVCMTTRAGVRASNGKPQPYPFIPYRLLK